MFLHINPSYAETKIIRENMISTIAADVVVHCNNDIGSTGYRSLYNSLHVKLKEMIIYIYIVLLLPISSARHQSKREHVNAKYRPFIVCTLWIYLKHKKNIKIHTPMVSYIFQYPIRRLIVMPGGFSEISIDQTCKTDNLTFCINSTSRIAVICKRARIIL